MTKRKNPSYEEAQNKKAKANLTEQEKRQLIAQIGDQLTVDEEFIVSRPMDRNELYAHFAIKATDNGKTIWP